MHTDTIRERALPVKEVEHGISASEVIAGAGDGPTIVLVPGWRRDHTYWSQSGILEGLAGLRLPVIAIDLPGLGAPARDGSLLAQGVRTLRQVLDLLASEGHVGFVLAAHSTGAAVVAAYHEQLRIWDRAAVPGDFSSGNARIVGNFLLAPFGLGISDAVRRELRMARILLGLPSSLTARLRERLADEWSARPAARPIHADEVLEQLRLIRRYLAELNTRPAFPAVNGETVWVFNSHDHRTPPEFVRFLDWKENYRTTTLLGTGHTPSAPHEIHQVVTALSEFVRRVGRS